MPAHYLKQFHPKYVSKEELDKKVKDGKFDNWVSLFKLKCRWEWNAEVPTASTWMTTAPANNPTWVLERNPYYYAVDTEGNQLPYLDKIVLTMAENLEVLNLRAIAGEIDFQARHIDVAKLPVFLANQEKGGYKVHLDTSECGADAGLSFNLAYDADPEVAKWINITDFRRALSLGIDQHQLNEVFWLGLGTPGTIAPGEGSIHNPGPETRTKWSEYDLKKANEMLDKIGLDKKDAEGYRLRTDGKGRLRLEVQSRGVQFVQATLIAEMIRDQLTKVGIQVAVQEVERSLAEKRIQANEHQSQVGSVSATENMFTESFGVVPIDTYSALGSPFAVWHSSGGAKGKEPPPRMREAIQMYKEAFSVPEKESIELAKKIWHIVADECWHLGLVGLSVANTGVRVAKTNLGNNPSRMFNGSSALNPRQTKPETLFWKS